MNTKAPLLTNAQLSSKFSQTARFIKDLTPPQEFRSLTQRDTAKPIVAEVSRNVSRESKQGGSISDCRGGLRMLLSELLSIDTGIQLRLLPDIGNNKTNSVIASGYLRGVMVNAGIRR